MEKRWTEQEDEILRSMSPSSPADALIVHLPGRSWKGITLRATRLKLNRNRRTWNPKRWTEEDDRLVAHYCEQELDMDEIATNLGRSKGAVKIRIKHKGLPQTPSLKQKRFSWEISNLISPQQSSSERGYRG